MTAPQTPTAKAPTAPPRASRRSGRTRALLAIVGSALFALASILVAPLFGAEPVNPLTALAGLAVPEAERALETAVAVDIFFALRLPRILMAFVTGAALALVGAVFQAFLRNPLATPYTLGVSTGGAFGAVLALRTPALAFALGPFGSVHLFAFGGSLLAVAMIYVLAAPGRRISTMALLLAGVVMGAIFSALILLVRYFSEPERLVDMDRWMMGRIEVTGYRELLGTLPLLVPALALLLMQARGLNQVAFGEDFARGRGVDVSRLQHTVFFAGALATASVVAVAGPIGFVGLIVPHTMRRLAGPDHLLLLPCSLLAGGGFLVLCDTVARTILAPAELPVGIFTALLGGAFFLYLLLRTRGGRLFDLG